MNMQIIQQVGKKFMKKVPVLKPGSTVRVHQKIKEGGKERIQVFEGLVIGINAGNGPNKTFTVRKVVGGIGVEKIFPLYSSNITKINVTKSSDIRRSKLYYMRKRSGKSARLREKHLTEKDVVMEEIEGVEEAEKPAEEAEKPAEEKEPTKVTEEKAKEVKAAAEPAKVEQAPEIVQKEEESAKTEEKIEKSQKKSESETKPEETKAETEKPAEESPEEKK